MSTTFDLVKMLATELGYKIVRTRKADGTPGRTYSLENEKERIYFSQYQAKERDQAALNWLRRQA